MSKQFAAGLLGAGLLAWAAHSWAADTDFDRFYWWTGCQPLRPFVWV